MQNLKVDLKNTYNFISKKEIEGQYENALNQIKNLHNKTGKGNEFLGWLNIPSTIDNKLVSDIEKTAKELQNNSEIVVVIGIGGSYLGAKAVIESLSDNFSHLKEEKNKTKVIYAGQNLCEDYIHELLELLNNYSFSLIVISKSGTTTEPAISFRLLKEKLNEKYSNTEIKKRIVTITDEKNGALRKLSEIEGFKSFIIPNNVGGRFSVLTPVGLLPIAVAGYDIKEIINGALQIENISGPEIPVNENPAALYAIVRNLLYKNNKKIEILVNYHSKLNFLSEWWKQLYGESEGKELKGLFPVSVNFTTDLHSLGQYIQEGKRLFFETNISVVNPNTSVKIPKDSKDLDNLNYLSELRVNEVNKQAEQGTILAHLKGDVPNVKIEIPSLNEFYLGQLIYFFEKACAISGYLLGVNPFDQPGVEEYKKNMFELLGKPSSLQ
jgi:glucose-6-phosphate isomerase